MMGRKCWVDEASNITVPIREMGVGILLSLQVQVRLMEDQMAALYWKPGEVESRVHELQALLQDRDSSIQDLQLQLEEQKMQRQVDARQVEEKAQRIKDWVTCKLQELEGQNSLLVRENAELQAQVLTLRQRLLSLPANAAKEIYRLSIQDGRRSRPLSQCSDPPELPERGDSSYMESGYDYDTTTSSEQKDSSFSPDNTEEDNLPDTVSDIESEESIGAEMDQDLYQEIDANHESIYELKTSSSGPPQIRIDRKLFQGRLLDSHISSSNGSEEVLDRSRMSGGLGTPGGGGGGGGPVKGEFEDGEFIIAEDITPINLTPKSATTSFSFQNATTAAPPSTPTSNILEMNFAPPSSTSGVGVAVVTAAATLPRVRDHGHRGKPSPVKLVKSDNIDAAVSSARGRPLLSGVEIQVHHFGSEPHDMGVMPEKLLGVRFSSEERTFYSPHSTRQEAEQQQEARGKEKEMRGAVSDGEIVGGALAAASAEKVKDERTGVSSVTKYAASEKRAYAVAQKRSKGWKKTREHHHHSTSSAAVSAVVPQPGVCCLFQDASVPVYATLKGKAAQIRNTPFMEESSSDSSGDEEEVVVTEVISHGDAAKAGTDARESRSVSDGSCDYALPPEDVSSKSDSDTSEPEQKLLKFAADSQKHDTLEKCGYLSQLSGKVKTWRRRFFVLRNGELFFYKSQHDVFKKPQGSIVLDGQTKITKSATELSFEIINCKKTYYLTADSPAELERWIRVLQRVLRRRATGNLLDSVDSKAVVKGWITKVKNGVTRRCWCVLLGKHFLYFRSPGDKTPLGQINLQDAKLEEIEGACDSDDEADIAASPLHVFAIWPPCQAPTYLVIPTRQEKDSWLYHLTVATGGGTGTVGTDYEQFIAKLMQVNADANSGLWKHPLMLYTKEPLREPLTTLPSVDLQHKATELFRTLYQFMNTPIESPSLEFHVGLAQGLLSQCLEHPELQNELYCQLIKQTSRHPSQPKTAVQSLLLCGKHSWFLCDGSPTSPTSSLVDLTDCKLNPSPHALTQGWQLLALAVSLFMPKQTVTWLIKVHLHRHADPRSEVGKYAIYCQRALERTTLKGAREAPPSRMEVMSMLLRHPYHHSQPISIPVHFLNDSYQVVSFDGSTTVLEFVQSLNKMIGVRDPAQSGFALFADDPRGTGVEYCLEGHLKVCDVISKWEQALRIHLSPDSSDDSSRTIRLLYKNRLYFKNNSRQETEKEKLLLAYQVNEEIVHGRFPLNRDLALELASLMTQIFAAEQSVVCAIAQG
ncbi:hypothetical protein ACOMHN_012770 [Nucella lapillus]